MELLLSEEKGRVVQAVEGEKVGITDEYLKKLQVSKRISGRDESQVQIDQEQICG